MFKCLTDVFVETPTKEDLLAMLNILYECVDHTDPQKAVYAAEIYAELKGFINYADGFNLLSKGNEKSSIRKRFPLPEREAY